MKIRNQACRFIFITVLLAAVLAGCSAGRTSPDNNSGVTSGPSSTFAASPASDPFPTITAVPPSAAPATVSPAPAPGLSPVPTIIPGPDPSVTAEPPPLPPYTPDASPFKPEGELAELFDYMLQLINRDRQEYGLSPVTLGFNAAAQKHAQDMFDNYFISHWGTDGLKPYMRYTIEGGLRYEQENSAYSGWYDRTENPDSYAPIDVRQELQALQAAMMAEVPPDDGHRRNILNKSHTSVNLGIAYDDKRLALVQQFEGDYIEFTHPPVISGNTLVLSGRFQMDSVDFNNISIFYDPLPQALTQHDLLNVLPDHYNLGDSDPPQETSLILPPPPPGQMYSSLPPHAIQAERWDLDQSGRFFIQADISSSLSRGKGVYTLALIVKLDGEPRNITSYSIFVE